MKIITQFQLYNLMIEYRKNIYIYQMSYLGMKKSLFYRSGG
ncbi:Uncharacterised protein [Escherichia coli]|nr:Uncharacterised protein [Escherichia coli]VWN20621.1 Uncharacterised protein [Escherichia coli]